jgi:hypothetical protein
LLLLKILFDLVLAQAAAPSMQRPSGSRPIVLSFFTNAARPPVERVRDALEVPMTAFIFAKSLASMVRTSLVEWKLERRTVWLGARWCAS